MATSTAMDSGFRHRFIRGMERRHQEPPLNAEMAPLASASMQEELARIMAALRRGCTSKCRLSHRNAFFRKQTTYQIFCLLSSIQRVKRLRFRERSVDADAEDNQAGQRKEWGGR